jgi:hypothetical protein
MWSCAYFIRAKVNLNLHGLAFVAGQFKGVNGLIEINDM